MCRYAESLTALSTALNLMIEEGDTLLVAAIAHPLHLAETQIMDKHDQIIATRIMTLPEPHRIDGIPHAAR